MADLTGTQQSAFDASSAYLKSIGLNPDDYKELITNAAVTDMDPTTFSQTLQQSAPFQAAFPEIGARLKAGLSPMKPSEIISYRENARTLGRNYGLPANFMNQDTITNLVAGDVSPSELQDRIVHGYTEVQNAPDDVKNTLYSYFGDQGLTPGHLLAYMLDPTKGTDLIHRELATAQIGAAATRGGYGAISAQEAGGLQGAGVTSAQAETGFAALGRESELMGALPGESGAQTIGRAEQLGTIVAPQGATEQELQRRARERKAEFEGGGGLIAASTGVTGLATQR